jgi:hypothetical protein
LQWYSSSAVFQSLGLRLGGSGDSGLIEYCVDFIVCSMQLVWLFSSAWDALKGSLHLPWSLTSDNGRAPGQKQRLDTLLPIPDTEYSAFYPIGSKASCVNTEVGQNCHGLLNSASHWHGHCDLRLVSGHSARESAAAAGGRQTGQHLSR